MRNTRKRITVGLMAALFLTVVALVSAIGASAHDGRGRDDGARAEKARGHDAEHQRARQKADDDNDDGEQGAALLSSSLAPSLPTDPAIHGVAAGGAPWALRHGSVRIDAAGRLEVRVTGLVIPVAHAPFPAGTARPVTVVSASLYCAPDSSAAVATTASAPISKGGNAEISQRITLPATCLAPIVLVHPNQLDAVYIAASGWRR